MQKFKFGSHPAMCHRRLSFAALSALISLCCLLAGRTRAQSLQDYFTNRLTITNLSGQISQSNSNATVEPGEPKHGGKPGGHSLWISWVAVTNGIASFKTEASGFDTLLSAYQFTTTNGTTFADLREVARADDSEGLERESEIEFGVAAGQRFEIAVDGYFGAVGQVDLQWLVKPLPSPPPIITNTLPDRAVNLGDTVSLASGVTNSGAGTYKWLLNGNEINGTSTTLTISSFAVTNVGRYVMRVSPTGGPQYFSVPVEVQINTEGSQAALAQGKLLDSPATALGGDNAILSASRSPIRFGGGTGVVRGYNGSQIFSTLYALVDPAEPAHCNTSGGASYWLTYDPPANGTITLDTVNSAYDTVMEVYTYNGALNSYQDLISLGCNDNAPGLGTASRLVVPVVKTRPYVIVVQGVNGARGTGWINYGLNTNQLPQPPTLLSTPVRQAVAPGSDVLLAPSFTGSPPMRLAWKKNSTLIAGQTGPSLFLTRVTTDDSANYVLTVTNDLGGIATTMPLAVLGSTTCSLALTAQGMQIRFPTVFGIYYTVEEATALRGPWEPWPNYFIGDGQPVVTYVPGLGTRFYRVRIQ